MERITGPAGTTISYDRYGSGPPLVLVHGGFSDHITNWGSGPGTAEGSHLEL
jgi:hypothetical protein